MGFPGFTEYGKVFYVQLFLVIFREVLVLSDNPLQPPCPLENSKLTTSEIASGQWETSN